MDYWRFYGIWLAILSIITFVMYGIDKAQSRQRRPARAGKHIALDGFIGGISRRLGGTFGVPA